MHVNTRKSPPIEKGQFRRFGEAGPVYEVRNVWTDPRVGRVADIQLPESGEELTFNVEALAQDPLEV